MKLYETYYETYKDPQINKNFRKASSFSFIGLILGGFSLVVYITDSLLGLISVEIIPAMDIRIILFLPGIPLSVYINSTRYSKIYTNSNTDDTQKTRKNKISYEYTKATKWDNDYSNLLTKIIFSFSLLYLTIFFVIDIILDDNYNHYIAYVYKYVGIFGYCLIPHIPVYIAYIFLFKNLKLIRRIWKDNPPQFVIEEREREKKEEEQELKDKELAEHLKKERTYKNLIEKCGTRFFIKYYKQILRLPLRDIEITENYSSEERNERLISAKTIIDKGLSEFAFTQIIDAYGNVLSEEEIEQAKTLLAEIKE